MSLFFSVIIPTYNRAHLVGEAIQSVLNQTYPHFELLVIDDGSTDDTKEKVLQIKDPRVKYFYKVNEERAIARNFGTNRSKGDYITFLDSDDLLYPHCLERCAAFITKNKNVAFVSAAHDMFDFSGKMYFKGNFSRGFLNQLILEGNHLSCIGNFLEREVALENPFNTNPAIITSEDWELWLRLSARYPMHAITESLACMREHPGRSLNSFDLGKKMYLTECLLISLRNDDVFMEKFGNKINRIESEMVSLMALDLALARKTMLSLSFFGESISIYPQKIWARRTLAIIKIALLNYLKSFFNTGSK